MNINSKDISIYLIILGLDQEESITEKLIKDKYRELAKLYHPDTNRKTASSAQFIKITEAKDYLIDNLEYANIYLQQKESSKKQNNWTSEDNNRGYDYSYNSYRTQEENNWSYDYSYSSYQTEEKNTSYNDTYDYYKQDRTEDNTNSKTNYSEHGYNERRNETKQIIPGFIFAIIIAAVIFIISSIQTGTEVSSNNNDVITNVKKNTSQPVQTIEYNDNLSLGDMYWYYDNNPDKAISLYSGNYYLIKGNVISISKSDSNSYSKLVEMDTFTGVTYGNKTMKLYFKSDDAKKLSSIKEGQLIEIIGMSGDKWGYWYNCVIK